MFKSLIAFCLSRRPVVVVGLLVFAGAGIIAFKRLNIEAYPNPTPVILEITAQAPGLSAEEMERYYTIPTEIGLYTTPAIDIIRSTSFYGLSFVRVSFKYGVDYNFAHAQASVAMAQNHRSRESPAQLCTNRGRRQHDGVTGAVVCGRHGLLGCGSQRDAAHL
jgi:cobalt-zinc-cadmium resistance protein CzcA